MQECKKGDKGALNLFYLRFAPRMLSVIHRYIHDRKDAEDVLHDGFIIGLTRLDSLHDNDRVEIWLATIMRNLSLRFLQNQNLAEILYDIPEEEETPDMSEFLDMATLENLITRLPAGYQKVFRLAILENKSHKEIGRMLGIAPNTSSSQLFHAKLLMRQLIKEYKLQVCLGCVLIIGLLTGVIIYNHDTRIPTLTPPALSEIATSGVGNSESESMADTLLNNLSTQNVSAKSLTAPYAPNHPGASRQARRTHSEENVASEIKQQESSTMVEEETLIESEHLDSSETHAIAATDSIGSNDMAEPRSADDAYYAFSHPNEAQYGPVNKLHKSNGWSFTFGADPALLSFNQFGNAKDNLADYEYPPTNNEVNPDTESPSDEACMKNPQQMMRASDYKSYERVAQQHSLPVTVAVTASKSLNDILSVESGVRYSYLHSTFETQTSKAHCHWHYAGIPLKLNVKIFSSHSVMLYAGAGGMVDIPLHSNASVTTTATSPDLRPGSFRSPVVWSLSGNLGLSIKLTERINIFLEPTLQYRFPHNYTVPNNWTENKWGVSLPLGIRFDM